MAKIKVPFLKSKADGSVLLREGLWSRRIHPAIPTTADAHHYTSNLYFLQIYFAVWTNKF